METDYESLKKRFDEINEGRDYGVIFDSMLKLISELCEQCNGKNEKRKKTKGSTGGMVGNDD